MVINYNELSTGETLREAFGNYSPLYEEKQRLNGNLNGKSRLFTELKARYSDEEIELLELICDDVIEVRGILENGDSKIISSVAPRDIVLPYVEMQLRKKQIFDDGFVDDQKLSNDPEAQKLKGEYIDALSKLSSSFVVDVHEAQLDNFGEN